MILSQFSMDSVYHHGGTSFLILVFRLLNQEGILKLTRHILLSVEVIIFFPILPVDIRNDLHNFLILIYLYIIESNLSFPGEIV